MSQIFFIAQGLFEKSNSIGYDCVYEYKVTKERFPEHEVRIFAEKFDLGVYPDVDIEPISAFFSDYGKAENPLVVYHFCDGWAELEAHLKESGRRWVTRWHNNTPPWFFAEYSLKSVSRTIRGLDTIVKLAESPNCIVWCNSQYTVDQIELLAPTCGSKHVVYPATRYLSMVEAATPAEMKKPVKRLANAEVDPLGWLSGAATAEIRILFVGRVVPHKGHRHIIKTAAVLQDEFGAKVSVCCPGRFDGSNQAYVDELSEAASKLGVPIAFPGEVDNDVLMSFYDSASVLLFLSEHEGFGLPIYEAMRIGKPVVAWSNTAVTEVLAGHPYVFESLDYKKIARGVLALQDEGCRQEVVSYQNATILPKYSREVVDNQIVAGLEASGVLGASSTTEVLEPLGASGQGVASGGPTEIRNNLITLYDLAAYRVLLQETNGSSEHSGRRHLDRVAALEVNGERHFNIAPSWFSRHGGSVRPGSKSIQVDLARPERHCVFGPYVKLSAGRYRCEFDLSVRDVRSRSGAALVLDVATSAGILADKRVSLTSLSSEGACRVSFELDADQDEVEFRIAAHNIVGGVLEFNGARLIWREVAPKSAREKILKKLSDFNSLRKIKVATAALAKREEVHLGELSMTWGKKGFALRRRSKASALFQAARLEMKRKEWLKASSNYKAALELEANHFEMWVQFGHALKESGDLDGSKQAYLKAQRLNKGDPDLQLNMGHLRKVSGKIDSALPFYVKSATLARAGSLATLELIDAGYSTDDVKKILQR